MNDNNSYLNLNEFRTANQGADRNALYTEKKFHRIIIRSILL